MKREMTKTGGRKGGHRKQLRCADLRIRIFYLLIPIVKPFFEDILLLFQPD